VRKQLTLKNLSRVTDLIPTQIVEAVALKNP
jgi:hypothetical protein